MSSRGGQQRGEVTGPRERALILAYASELLDPACRAPGAVLGAARELQEWADQAAGGEDLAARMRALQRASISERDRRSATAVTLPRATPRQLLTEARAYYDYMAGPP